MRPPARDFYRSCGAPPYPLMETHFPRHGVLRDNWRAIRDEALAIHAQGRAKKIKGDMFFTTIADDGWKRFYIRWYGPAGADARALALAPAPSSTRRRRSTSRCSRASSRAR